MKKTCGKCNICSKSNKYVALVLNQRKHGVTDVASIKA